MSTSRVANLNRSDISPYTPSFGWTRWRRRIEYDFVRMPAIVKAQTTRQAKASFKARGRPSLSAQEQRQLERAIELEDRAERAKEADKRRAEAARKRAETLKKDKSERERGQLLSQRRCDKFGFKASQSHLGAFFGKNGMQKKPSKVDEAPEDVFEDDGLDDEELLQALEQPKAEPKPPNANQVPKSDAVLMPPPSRPITTTSVKLSIPEPTSADYDLRSFWDELESSTQIARELSTVSPEQRKASETRASSFNSEDFDLTAEDLDELDPPKPATPRAVKAQRAMPPPALPAKPQAKAMPPPPVPAKRLQNKVKTQNAIRGPFLPASSLYCSPELGFTLSQLENFVDDDLQLTQAVPG